MLLTYVRIQRGTGSPDPPPAGNDKNIGFLSNIDLVSLKNHKATKPAFNGGPLSARQRNAISMAFHWRADDGPFIAVLGSSLPSSTKKGGIKFGPPLTKLSGSAHEILHYTLMYYSIFCVDHKINCMCDAK